MENETVVITRYHRMVLDQTRRAVQVLTEEIQWCFDEGESDSLMNAVQGINELLRLQEMILTGKGSTGETVAWDRLVRAIFRGGRLI